MFSSDENSTTENIISIAQNSYSRYRQQIGDYSSEFKAVHSHSLFKTDKMGDDCSKQFTHIPCSRNNKLPMALQSNSLIFLVQDR
jgi:hypothetical protein